MTDRPTNATPESSLVRLGAWLFRWRTVLPLPIAAVLLLVPPHPGSRTPVAYLGVLIVMAGEGLRVWAVRHIGVISRTRSDRLGPLVTTGPFSLMRNPLYAGNLLLWLGLSLSARLIWLAPFVVGCLVVAYHAIVKWEEELLAARLGRDYRAYVARVPRWVPVSGTPQPAVGGFSWRETLFSERGTLIAIGVGYVLLYLKDRILS
jgi:protein-S-isoprenylcysteine O-methyltransferase Ste14